MSRGVQSYERVSDTVPHSVDGVSVSDTGTTPVCRRFCVSVLPRMKQVFTRTFYRKLHRGLEHRYLHTQPTDLVLDTCHLICRSVFDHVMIYCISLFLIFFLKQLRFAGDLLMELGASVELATAAVPHLFLPLACAANMAKNVAAVTSTSTHTPIYKAYARGENIGDVTAKGESVANIADLLGTGLSIFISKRNSSIVASFILLSFGYIFSSYGEGVFPH
ncbi:protein root UVB sensitive 6-like isoform X2 [Dioscorea cayenensis subsp. rotundata]|uniref:Protein root UVB sensitive 6-like isoform X2 n=1 Tax=Dioscorea cayennensis subsp. rotundata TaxID=55577 RepID=A0AB40CKZ0_DIOCR|nr:protein root UVB sensitive 6-like isoform X2 [Dioscorea cayenensis subsp. rotundata]